MTRKEVITSKEFWHEVIANKISSLAGLIRPSKVAQVIVDDHFMSVIKELSEPLPSVSREEEVIISIQDGLYATGRFTTDECETLAEGLMSYIADSIATHEPEAPAPSDERKKTLEDFCEKISSQKDCPPEFIEIVNKNFMDLLY